MDFTLKAAELQSKKVSFLNSHFLRESSTGKPEPLANAAFDTPKFVVVVVAFGFCTAPQNKKRDVAH